MHFAPGQIALNGPQRLELQRVAEVYSTSAGKIHIFGIARGQRGDRAVTSERMRRLIAETSSAAQYLTGLGIRSDQLELRTSEEQLTSNGQSAGALEDADRLEIFIE